MDNRSQSRRELLARLRDTPPPPPPNPAGADWRSIRGFPDFRIDRDGAVWSCRQVGGLPCPWRRVAVIRKGREGMTPSVVLRGPNRRISRIAVARLLRESFLRPELPEGNFRHIARDDDDDQSADALRLPPTMRSIASARKPRVTMEPPAPSPRPARCPAPPIARLVSRPAPVHPGGPLRLGPSVRGSNHGRAKLDEPKVARMKRLRLEGWSTGRLAREFSVGRNTVCYVLIGKTWAGVEPEPAANGGNP